MNRAILKQNVDLGLAISKIATELGVGRSTVRYWLKKYDLRTQHQTGACAKNLQLDKQAICDAVKGRAVWPTVLGCWDC